MWNSVLQGSGLRCDSVTGMLFSLHRGHLPPQEVTSLCAVGSGTWFRGLGMACASMFKLQREESSRWGLDGGQIAEGRQFHSLGGGLRCDVAITGF